MTKKTTLSRLNAFLKEQNADPKKDQGKDFLDKKPTSLIDVKAQGVKQLKESKAPVSKPKASPSKQSPTTAKQEVKKVSEPKVKAKEENNEPEALLKKTAPKKTAPIAASPSSVAKPLAAMPKATQASTTKKEEPKASPSPEKTSQKNQGEPSIKAPTPPPLATMMPLAAKEPSPKTSPKPSASPTNESKRASDEPKFEPVPWPSPKQAKATLEKMQVLHLAEYLEWAAFQQHKTSQELLKDVEKLLAKKKHHPTTAFLESTSYWLELYKTYQSLTLDYLKGMFNII